MNDAPPDWNKLARYRIYLTEDGNFHRSTEVASWLDYETAVRMRDSLNARLPGEKRWASPMYGIELIVPRPSKSAPAAVGDLVIHRVTETVRPLAGGTMLLTESLQAGVVTDIDSSGRVAQYRGYNGFSGSNPVKPVVVSAQDVNVEALMNSIEREIAQRGVHAGRFLGLTDFSRHLVLHQHLQPAKLNTAIDLPEYLSAKAA